MNANNSLRGKRFAIFGMGVSGIAAALCLAQYGAHVFAWDDTPRARENAQHQGVHLTDLYKIEWSEIDELILAPGIPLNFPKPHPIVELARGAGCAIIGDIEMLGRLAGNAHYMGITGTNGKSTTTSLIGHMFDGERTTQVGGNLGKPALAMDILDAGELYVLEMSSYQIDLTPTHAFDVAVLLNISPDHLDRHGDMAGYIAAKAALFDHQRENQTAIIGIDTAPSRKIYETLKATNRQSVIPISGSAAIEGGVYVLGSVLIDDRQFMAETIMDIGSIPTLNGIHNYQNVAAAYAAVRAMGMKVEDAVAKIKTFPGLVHRQELVDTIDGVLFINDSKATNADATARALASYKNIYWIAGGQMKEGGLDALIPTLENVRSAYLIGEGAAEIERVISDQVNCTIAHTVGEATNTAFQDALKTKQDNPVVMLSPACASFDQYKNFEARGDDFKKHVLALRVQQTQKTQGLA